MALYNGVPSRLRPKAKKTPANASMGAGIAYVPDAISQVAQGDPSAVPAGTPTNTFVDPVEAARKAALAQFSTYLQGPVNAADATYGTAVSQSLGGEGVFAGRIGASLGARADPNDASYDPAAVTQGSFDWGNVEANNPFSQAGLLQRHYQQAKAGTLNGLSAAGLGNSSAMQHAQGQNTFDYQQGQNTLINELTDYLTGGANDRKNALNTKNSTISGAGLDALRALLGS